MSAVETRVVSRMTRAALEAEVYRLRHVDRDLRTLQRREAVIGPLRIAVADEHDLRVAAERNARNFHALLIAERVKHLPTTSNGRVGSPVRASADAATGGNRR